MGGCILVYIKRPSPTAVIHEVRQSVGSEVTEVGWVTAALCGGVTDSQHSRWRIIASKCSDFLLQFFFYLGEFNIDGKYRVNK